MENVWERIEDHEKRLRCLEKSIAEIRGELKLNTGITLVVLGSILALITIVL